MKSKKSEPKKLILINGNHGMGKTTLAQRYVDEHPMTLNLDIDNIWIMMGQWDKTRPYSVVQKMKYAYAIADMHLTDGYDVIVPQLMQTTEQYERFEQIAATHNAIFKEIVLLSTEEDAIERCKTRAYNQGHPEGFRPGGILDQDGREKALQTMHKEMLATIALRPNIIRITSVEDEHNHTYSKLVNAINS